MALPSQGRVRLFTPGALFAGKYRLVRAIAEGGGGEIWVARNEATHAKVALKLLRRNGRGAADEEAVARFRQEARIGGMLSHRNIVKVYDLIEHDGGAIVLVMELLSGETVGSYLKRRAPLHPREAVALTLPILSALRHAHENNVIHRDLSPRNVFLVVDPDGHVIPKLVDFGLAKVPDWELKTLEGSLLGTPAYMSPEQIRGVADLDARSDLYSVGAVLYEMLSGQAPFRGPSPTATLVAVLEAKELKRLAVTDKLWNVVVKALDRDREARFQDAQAMAFALLDALDTTDEALAMELNHSSALMVSDEVQQALLEAEVPSASGVRPSTASLAAELRKRKLLRLAPYLALGVACAALAGATAYLYASGNGEDAAHAAGPSEPSAHRERAARHEPGAPPPVAAEPVQEPSRADAPAPQGAAPVAEPPSEAPPSGSSVPNGAAPVAPSQRRRHVATDPGF